MFVKVGARLTATAVLCAGLVPILPIRAVSQTTAELEDYFKNSIRLSAEQINNIREGKAVVKVMKPRRPAEVFLFGAVYVKGAPESYFQLATDFEGLRKLPQFLVLGRFSDPPQVGDLDGFGYDEDEVRALKECVPHHCDLQMPAEAIEDLHKSVDWDAPDVLRRINQHLHERVVEGLQEYKREGNRALGVYLDRENPRDVAKQFEYMLSYSEALPKYLPDLHQYLLDYPRVKPSAGGRFEDRFYWAKVKFGLKPTLRIVQMVVRKGQSANEPAYAIGEKQLYSSHYFQTALDLTFCVRDTANPRQGFYLIKAMASEQAGLETVKGSMIRKIAVGRADSSLEKSLNAIKDTLEKSEQ